METPRIKDSSKFTDILISLLNEGIGLGVRGHVAGGGGRHDDDEEQGQNELGHLVVVVRGAREAEL